MERIVVDMDGVLADVFAQYVAYDERDFGKRRSIDEVIGKEEMDAFPNGRKYVTTPGFFRTAPVIAGSRKVLKELNSKYDLFVVSSATEYPQSLNEKMEWLAEHFAFISWRQIVLCGSKRIVRGDIMVDDHFKNLDFFDGRTLLFTQPHNQLRNDHRHKRVNSWQEIAEILL